MVRKNQQLFIVLSIFSMNFYAAQSDDSTPSSPFMEVPVDISQRELRILALSNAELMADHAMYGKAIEKLYKEISNLDSTLHRKRKEFRDEITNLELTLFRKREEVRKTIRRQNELKSEIERREEKERRRLLQKSEVRK
ncbi:MAG TPA: hypothetical protein VLG50_03835 [Candidatus Saccharimonadales bacterium]|nr:hypothetical protein [Candidatus Saccharimonadales bacterium]